MKVKSDHCSNLYLAPNVWLHAQLVEHRTGIAEVTGLNPVEALIFFSGFFFTAMITLHFHLQPQYKYELFHINFIENSLLLKGHYHTI